MSDTFHFPEPVYTERLNAPVVKAQTRSRQLLKICMLILFLFLLGETVFHFFILPFISPVKVQISGIDSIAESDIKKTAGLTGTEKWGKLKAETVFRRLTAYPLIAEAKVSKKYPNKLNIEIIERKPVGVLLATVGGRTVPMEIDKTGTVFKKAAKESLQTLPVISGLTFRNIRAGMKVHKQLASLFMQLDILQKKNPALLSEISEMKIEQKKYGGFDLILYPVQTQIKVRIDSALNEERLRYMMLMLDVIRELDLSTRIEELDVRAGTASYRLRGESNE